jgi:hypothetical protein
MCILLVKGQNQDVTINADGTVTPLSAPIHQTGNTYTLTADISSPLIVETNNIVVNGGNHTIKELDQHQNGTAINLIASNVTVKNFFLIKWNIGIYVIGNNNTITANEFDNNTQSVVIHGCDCLVNYNVISNSSTAVLMDTGAYRQTGDNNLIIQNQIVHNLLAFDTANSNGTTLVTNDVLNNSFILALSNSTTKTVLYDNNFINNSEVLDVPNPFPSIVIAPFTPNVVPVSPAGQWDDGKIGNYWSNYLTIYPQATEIDHTGIGNTPYVTNDTMQYSFSVNRYAIGGKSWALKGTAVLAIATDNHPLMAEISISEINLTAPSVNTSTQVSHYLTFAVLAVVAVFVIASVSILLFGRYRKKLKENEQNLKEVAKTQ